VHTPLAIPGDDFAAVVDRLPGEGLRLAVDYVTERHFNLQITGISLSGMGDSVAAALPDHALDAASWALTPAPRCAASAAWRRPWVSGSVPSEAGGCSGWRQGLRCLTFRRRVALALPVPAGR
jgi:hypothetical protein